MHPSFDLCVTNTPSTQGAPHIEPHGEVTVDLDTAILANYSLWLHAADFDVFDCDSDMLTLQHQESCAVICMQAQSATDQNLTIALQQNECIFLF